MFALELLLVFILTWFDNWEMTGPDQLSLLETKLNQDQRQGILAAGCVDN